MTKQTEDEQRIIQLLSLLKDDKELYEPAPGVNHITDEELAAYWDGNLSAHERTQFRTHTEGCPACRRLVGSFLQTMPEIEQELARGETLPCPSYIQEIGQRVVRGQLLPRIDLGRDTKGNLVVQAYRFITETARGKAEEIAQQLSPPVPALVREVDRGKEKKPLLLKEVVLGEITVSGSIEEVKEEEPYNLALRLRLTEKPERPVGGCQVKVYDEGGNEIIQCESDVDGISLFYGLPAGKNRVTLMHPDYGKEGFELSLPEAASQPGE